MAPSKIGFLFDLSATPLNVHNKRYNKIVRGHGVFVTVSAWDKRVPDSKHDSTKDPHCTWAWCRVSNIYHWCSAEVWREEYRSSHLTTVQNEEIRQK
ncbi:hypothetical protein AVEN_136090-1 [Araneus ventricosus]|uniref:Uncharacterized protein n=1 Tax=Araneus ventricosus TaxID=182803 RepID=A0A4Y2NBS0_ARAVE|nr:hypothetical protein AVEN_136090-1 [Araneus ventricosus]